MRNHGIALAAEVAAAANVKDADRMHRACCLAGDGGRSLLLRKSDDGRGAAVCFDLLMTKIFPLVPVLLALMTVVGSAEASRDQLRTLVEKCLGLERASDCPALVADRDPADEAGCRNTTQIWEKSAEFVVIRDLKECGCPGGFRHGLAMPLTYV